MKIGQEIILGSGNIMRKATIRIIKDDKLGIEFIEPFFEKGTIVNVVVNRKKTKGIITAKSKNHAILQIKSLGTPAAWDIVHKRGRSA